MIFSKRSLMIFFTILCLPSTSMAMELFNQQAAYIDVNSNRAMVPLRWVGEKLGACVEWKPSLQEVLISQNGKEISLKIGATLASIDGRTVLMDQPVVVHNDFAFVPVRFISEALGAHVNWLEDSRRIELSTKDATVQLQINDSAESSDVGYNNDRFSNVKVTKVGEDKYQISGQATVSEGQFEYVVEDGHNQLLNGSATAGGSAPKWGAFNLEINVKKAQENSILILVLFEQGEKDSRRLSELVIPLP